MACVARFAVHVHVRFRLLPQQLKAYCSLFVIDTDSFNTRFIADGVDDLMDIFLAIQHHAVIRRPFDDVANTICSQDSIAQILFRLMIDAKLCEDCRSDQHDEEDDQKHAESEQVQKFHGILHPKKDKYRAISRLWESRHKGLKKGG